MASNEYAFLTHWRVEATPERVYRIIDDVLAYPQWWSEVWLSVTELEPGDVYQAARYGAWLASDQTLAVV